MAKSIQEQIADRAQEIALKLGIRQVRERIAPSDKRDILRALSRATRLASSGPDHSRSLYADLRSVMSRIEPRQKRAVAMCLTLLRRLYAVPPGPLLNDVMRIVKEAYFTCEQGGYRQLIRRELDERLWDPYRRVREAVATVLELDDVTLKDVEALRRLAAPPDVRLAVARRIVHRRQAAYIPSLLEYMVQRVSIPARPDEIDELRGVESLFGELRHFGMAVMLKPLYDMYEASYETPDRRGWLMKALAGFGEPLVPQLKTLYQSNTGREPPLRLLRQLAGGLGVPSAFQALIDLAEETRDTREFDLVTSHILRAAEDTAVRPPNSEWSSIREQTEDFAKTLIEAEDDSKQLFGHQLAGIQWDVEVSEALFEKIAAGTMSRDEEARLRRGGRPVGNFCLMVIRDPSRTNQQKHRAVAMLVQIYGIKRATLVRDELWALYRDSGDESLRIAAIAALADVGFMPFAEDSEDRAAVVASHMEAAEDEESKARLARAWERLFPRVPRPSMSEGS